MKQLDMLILAIKSASKSITYKIRSDESKHPWLIGSKQYRQIRIEIQRADRVGDRASVLAKRKVLRKLYHKLKDDYCKQRLNEKGNPMDLFNFMNFIKIKQQLPENMTLDQSRRVN